MVKNNFAADETFKAAFLPTRIFCKVEIENIGLGFLVCIFFKSFVIFEPSLLIYCSLLLSLFKKFDSFFFPCWRFSSFVFFCYVFLLLF